MTPVEAAAILRGAGASIDDRTRAALMGAEALEFQAWVFGYSANQWIRLELLMRTWNGEDSFLDYALGEWRKEKYNGR